MKNKKILIGEAKDMIGFEIITTKQHIVVKPESIELIKKQRQQTQQDVDNNYLIDYYELISNDGINFYKSETKKTIEYKKLVPIPFGP